MGQMQTQTNALGSSMVGLKTAALGLVGGLGGILVISKIKSVLVDFGDTMGMLQGVTGATEQQMLKMEQAARALGATTRFSASQAGEGMLNLARAGFSVDESIGAITPTLDLATSAQISLARASEIVAGAIRQFGLDIAETTHVTDIFVNTANSAATDVHQLGEAMSFAGTPAAALGINIEQTAAAIGILGDVNIKASMAGTNLRGIIAALVGPSEKLNKALERLNLSYEDVDIKSNDLISVFKKFKAAALGAEEAQDIFGRRNFSAALAIAENVEKLEELTRVNEEVGNVAKENAAIMDQTLGGSLKSLASAAEEAMIAIGKGGFGGALQSLSDTIGDVLRVMAGMENDLRGNAALAKSLAASVGIMVKAFSVLLGLKLLVFFKNLTSALWLSVAAFHAQQIGARQASAGALLYATSTTTATAATTGLTTAMAFNPVTAWAVALTLIGSAIWQFTSAVSASTTEVEDFNDELGKTAGIYEQQFAKIEAQKKRAKTLDEPIIELEAMDAEIATLIKLSEDLRNKLTKDTEEVKKAFELVVPDNQELKDAVEERKKILERNQNDIIEMFNEMGRELEFPELTYESVLGQLDEDVKIELIEGKIKQLTRAFDELQKSIVEDADALKESQSIIDSYKDSLRDELELMGKSKNDQEIITALREAQNEAMKKGVTLTEANKKELQSEIEFIQFLRGQLEKLAQARADTAIKKAAQKSLDDYINSLRTEVELLKLDSDEREFQIALQHAQNIAAKAGIEVTDEQVESIRRLVEKRRELRDLERAKGKMETKAGPVGVSGTITATKGESEFVSRFTGGMDDEIAAMKEQLSEVPQFAFFDSLRESLEMTIVKLEATRDVTAMTMTAMETGITQAGAAMAGAFIEMAIAGDLSGKKLAQVAFQMASNTLKALAMEAAGKALFALAEGLLFNDPKKLAAAAIYGKLAVSAGAGAIATGIIAKSMGDGGSAGSQERQRFSSGRSQTAADRGITAGGGGAPVQYHWHIDAVYGNVDAEWVRNVLAPITRRASKDGTVIIEGLPT